MRKEASILKKYEFTLEGLDCANCAREVEEELQKNSGLKNVCVSFAKLKLTYETDTVSEQEVIDIVLSVEPEVKVISCDEKSKSSTTNETKNQTKAQILRLILGCIVAFVGLYFEKRIGTNFLATLLIILGYCILLYRTAKTALKMLVKSHNINENFLVTISCIGAYLVGEHKEGLMVIILYEIGKILEDRAINKSRKSISDLMNIKPEYANLKIDNGTKEVSPEQVKIKDIVVIKPGEKIPLDGKVVKGEASLNMASLTGESKLSKVKVGDTVLSGSVNEEGIIEVEVTEKYENSTVNRILDLVQNATDKKAKTETSVNRISKIYTPLVAILAVIVAIILPVINNNIGYNESIYRALIFLVISCPCSIAISVPLSYFSGIGKASKDGILIKGSNFLDTLKDVKEIGFDKTGTLTKGKFGISKIEILNKEYSEDVILEYVVIGESFSNHPIAKSIIDSSKLKVDSSNVKDYNEIAGQGISYSIDGKKILVGNSSLVDLKSEDDSFTVIYVKIEEELVAKIYLEDTLKHGSKEAIKALNKIGIITKMFTGDKKQVAEKIAKELEIKEFKAELLPEDKFREIENSIKKYENTYSRVAFVGDGINDSPVLALADVGISMGGVGQAAAIEASDIVIMTDDLNKIIRAIEISQKTCNIIKQNLIFAISIKVLTLILSTFGLAGMWQAIFADVGVTLITIFNTLRILK